MDHHERQRLKQLANDSIIATFGQDSRESRLAEALEKCIEELELIATDCEHCRLCGIHGDCDLDDIDQMIALAQKEVDEELP